jgi:hypothetical protein
MYIHRLHTTIFKIIQTKISVQDVVPGKMKKGLHEIVQPIDFIVVEMRGIEPLTSALRTLRSPS